MKLSDRQPGPELDLLLQVVGAVILLVLGAIIRQLLRAAGLVP